MDCKIGTSKEAQAFFSVCLFQVDGDALALCTSGLVYFARALRFQGGQVLVKKDLKGDQGGG